MSIDIYAQADVVTARLVVAPRDTAGNLETSFMEAIAAGLNSPHDLASILGLAPRLVLQVLGDLWRAGRVSVDTETNYETLSVTSVGLDELAAAAASGGALASTSKTATTEDVVIERLTGRALPKRASISRVPTDDRDLTVPVTPNDRQAADVSEGELVAALSESEREFALGETGSQRVIAAFLQPEKLQVSLRRRFVRLRALAHVTDTDELSVAVVDDVLTLAQREHASRRLQEVVDEQPRSKFARRLRERATRVPLHTRGVKQIQGELRRHLDTLEDCRPDARQQAHDRAGLLVGQISAYAGSRAAREMEVDLISGSDQHHQVVVDLIQRAEHQVAIGVPWVSAKGLEALRKPLFNAVERGVQIVFVWGIDGHREGLGDDVLQWLDSLHKHVLEKELPGRLLYSRQRAARSHAKLLISDDRQILVTSKNFLSKSDHTEVGVLLSALPGQESPVIEAGLQYIYDKAPSPKIALALRRKRGAFGPRKAAPELPFELPRLHRALLEEQTPEEYVRAWAAAWREAADRAEARLIRPRPTVETVKDLEHRGMIRDAVTRATERVLLTSDKLSEVALTMDLASLMAQRAADGLAIAIRYRSASVSLPGIATLTEEARTDLKRTDRMHAKVVLRDDTALVGSFNPLSVDANLRGRRSTGEFGVIVESTEVADAVWALLTGGPAPAPRRKCLTDPAADAAGYLALGIAEAADDESGTALVELAAKHGLDALLEARRSVGVGLVEDVRLAGACMAAALDSGRDPAHAAALALEDLLRAGNWGVANRIRSLVPMSDHRPHKSFTRALAEGGPAGLSLFTALTSGEDPDVAEADALIVADCVHLLLGDPGEDGNSDLLFQAADPSQAITSFYSAAVDYLRRYGALPTQPPVGLEGDTEGADRWDAAQQACDAFARYDSKSVVGNRLMKHLLAPSGELRLLDDALGARDAAAILRWRADYMTMTDDSKWLDRTVRALGLPRIVDSRRRSFTEHHSRVRCAVGDLCLSLGEVDSVPLEAWPSEQLSALGVLLRETARLVEAAPQTPEEIVVAAEARRVLRWAEGSATESPVRAWGGWPFVATFLCTAEDPDADVPLAALARDLAANRSIASAVEELARAGEFARAQAVIDAAVDPRSEEHGELSKLVGRHVAQSQDVVTADVRTLALNCERAGVDLTMPTIDVKPRLAEAQRRVAALAASTGAAVEARRAEIESLLPAAVDLQPGWEDYIRSLLAVDELELASHALSMRNGDHALPRPRPFRRWSWRDRSVREISGWLRDPMAAPFAGIDRFVPQADDEAGWAVVDALSALGDVREGAAHQWIDAVQRLLSADDDRRRPQLTVAGDALTATFRMPYDQRIPLLRWTRGEDLTVAVGRTSVPNAVLRFPLEQEPSTAPEPIVEIADVLSLLARADTSQTPTHVDRSLQFLALVCSRLDLGSIILPQDMPASSSASQRQRLAWLLSVLGLAADGLDVDRLSVWSGGHPGVMWSLVDAARKVPARPAGAVLETPERDQIVLRGVDLDFDHDEDVLLLGLGLAGGHLVEGCSEAELAELFEEEWRRGGRNPNHRVRVSEVVRRLLDRGYIFERGGRLHSCGCLTARTIERAATQEWLSERLERIDPDHLIQAAAYEFILDMVKHQHRAMEARLSEEELAERTNERLVGRLEDTSPFDLVELCATAGREYSRADVDVFTYLPDDPLWAQEAGPSIWIECLVLELLNNAIAATSDLLPGEATIRLTLEKDPENAGVALLSVRNNGHLMTAAAREAFERGMRVFDPARPANGTGLRQFRLFGEMRGVEIRLGETEHHETLVICRIPLAEHPQPRR